MKLPFVYLLATSALAACLFSCRTCPCEETAAMQATAAGPEESVKPGINDSFLDPELEVNKYVDRFEGESREVFANREAIVAAIEIKQDASVADVGAGTGPFIGLFAQAVGKEGKVYAIDIAPKFVQHLADRAQREGHANIEARLCSEDSVDLEPLSIDYAFICDVYHHFEFPRSTMGSLHSALRPGGEVVIVDFERIPGVSREWIMGHVRAGKEEVFAEMASFGFEMVEEISLAGLKENWVARFRKQ